MGLGWVEGSCIQSFGGEACVRGWTLARPGCGCKNNIKVGLEELVGLDWNGVAQEDDSLWAVLNTVMRLHVP